jgi:aminoglycoside 2'-N-acetyltransferase I
MQGGDRAVGDVRRRRAALRRAGLVALVGPTAVLAPDGIRATADDALFVRPVTARLNSAMPLVCDWRDGDVW